MLSEIDARTVQSIDVIEQKTETLTATLDEVYRKNKDRITELFDKSIDVVYLEKINALKDQNKNLSDRIIKLERQTLKLTEVLQKIAQRVPGSGSGSVSRSESRSESTVG